MDSKWSHSIDRIANGSRRMTNHAPCRAHPDALSLLMPSMPCNGGPLDWSPFSHSGSPPMDMTNLAQGWRGLGYPLWNALDSMQLLGSIRRTIGRTCGTRRDGARARAATVVDASNPAAGPRTPRPSSPVRSSHTTRLDAPTNYHRRAGIGAGMRRTAAAALSVGSPE